MAISKLPEGTLPEGTSVNLAMEHNLNAWIGKSINAQCSFCGPLRRSKGPLFCITKIDRQDGKRENYEGNTLSLSWKKDFLISILKTAMICLVDEEVLGLVESIEAFCSCVLWDFRNSVVFFLLSFSRDFTGEKCTADRRKNLRDGAPKIAFYGRYNYS